MVTVRPTMVSVSNRTPSAFTFSISRATTLSFGRRNSGMPYCSTPPSLCSASNTVTSYPILARSAAHANPEGPLPITATLCPLEATAARWLLPCSNSQSPTKRSSLPIATGSPLMPSTHAPSHCASCGQTRPHTEGSEESSAMTAAAPARSPASTLVMKFGILMETGQCAMHWGFLQFKQREASSCASFRSYP